MRKILFAGCISILFLLNNELLALNTWSLNYGISFNASTNKYKITFNLNNNGPDADAIYNFTIRKQAIPSGWGNYSFNVPGGWNTTVSSSGFIRFYTSSSETDKIYGMPVPQVNIVGSATFTWTFENLSGPDPMSTSYIVDDFSVRLREVDMAGKEGGTYKQDDGSVNIVPEPGSFLLISLGMLIFGFLKKRKFEISLNECHKY